MKTATARLPLLLVLSSLFMCVSGSSGELALGIDGGAGGGDDSQSQLWAELRQVRQTVAAQGSEVNAIRSELRLQKTLVEDLRRDARLGAAPKVAFSAALDCSDGAYGPFPTMTKVPFTDVLNNVGDAYSGATGTFTAPAKGLYHFHFSGIDDRSGMWMGVFLYKNEHSYKYKQLRNGSGGHLNLEFAELVRLERGDRVYVQIFQETRFPCMMRGEVTFSGFLLFSL